MRESTPSHEGPASQRGNGGIREFPFIFIWLQPHLGGGSLYDVGCYGVNVSRLILGQPQTAFAFGQIGRTGVDEVLGAVLRFEGDRLAVVDCGLTLSRREEIEIVGTDGRLAVPTAFLPGEADVEIHLVQGTSPSVLTIPGVEALLRLLQTGRAEPVRAGGQA